MAPRPSPTADVLFLITATLIGLLLKANVNNDECCDKYSRSRFSVSVTLSLLSKRKGLNDDDDDDIDDDDIIVCLFLVLIFVRGRSVRHTILDYSRLPINPLVLSCFDIVIE
jgi:hypothetical protein